MAVDCNIILGQSIFMVGMLLGPPEVNLSFCIVCLSIVSIICIQMFPRGILEDFHDIIPSLKDVAVFMTVPSTFILLLFSTMKTQDRPKERTFFLKLYMFQFYSFLLVHHLKRNNGLSAVVVTFVIAFQVTATVQQLILIFTLYVGASIFYHITHQGLMVVTQFIENQFRVWQQQAPIWLGLPPQQQGNEQRQPVQPPNQNREQPQNLPQRLSQDPSKNSRDPQNLNNHNSTRSGLASINLKERMSYLIEILTCPICLDVLKPPVVECVNGHLICRHCKNQGVYQCPKCLKSFSTVIRNTTIHQIIEDIIG